MVLLRLVQGFCLGGELPGALTYVVETAPDRAPAVCGMVFACVTMGVAVATGVSVAVRTWLPRTMVATLGWRIAFVLGGLCGLLSYVLRRSLAESPEFARMKLLASRRPLQEVLGRSPGTRRCRCVDPGCDSGLQRPVFRPHGSVHVQRAALRRAPDGQRPDGWRARSRTRHSGGQPARKPDTPRCAASRRRAGPRRPRVLRFTARSAAHSINPVLLLVSAGLVAGFVNGTFAVLLTEFFPTRVRFSGVALCFNVAFTIFSGTSPLVATALIQRSGLVTAPAFVMVACGLLTLAGSLGTFHAPATRYFPAGITRSLNCRNSAWCAIGCGLVPDAVSSVA